MYLIFRVIASYSLMGGGSWLVVLKGAILVNYTFCIILSDDSTDEVMWLTLRFLYLFSFKFFLNLEDWDGQGM